MKKRTLSFKKLLLGLALFIFISNYGQIMNRKQISYSLGTVSRFLDQIQQRSESETDTELKLDVSATDFLRGQIMYKKNKTPGKIYLEGKVTGNETGSFILIIEKNHLKGNIILPKVKKAYTYLSDAKGNAFIKETDINSIICTDYFAPLVFSEKEKLSNLDKNSCDISDLQSFPGANGCLLLDFDGYNLPAGTGWNNGNPLTASDSGMTSCQIHEAWELVAEDFRPFSLNVTTNENVFNNYPSNKRIRCVITSTNTVAPGYGGIAYINDFSLPIDRPCWVFTTALGTSGKFVGEATSHELGHTLGLSHDGSGTEIYYSGQGEWAPIMGLSYYKNVTQWSKGEYTSAKNHQDDLEIISGIINNVGYQTDNQGDTFANAAPLQIVNQQILPTMIGNQGNISFTDDIDMFTFTTTGGNVSLNLKTVDRHSDLRLKVTLYNSQHIAIDSYNAISTDLSQPIVINKSLSSGKYYLSVTGTSDGTGTTGYTSYASLGFYAISGTVPQTSSSMQNSDINIYPNPVKDFLKINLKPNHKYNILIMNESGQIIYSTDTTNSGLTIPFSGHPSGIYMVVVKNSAHKVVKSVRVIKQ